MITREEREELWERFQLSRDRIREIKNEDALSTAIPAEIREPLKNYVNETADYLDFCFFVIDKLGDGTFLNEKTNIADWDDISLNEWKEINSGLYRPLAGDEYEKSFLDPEKAQELGTFGPVLSFIYAEIMSMPGYIFDGKLFNIVTLLELYLEVYGSLCMDEAPLIGELESIVRYFVRDYADILVREHIEESFVLSDNTALQILENEDFQNEDYLYKYGEYISETEIKLAGFMKGLGAEELSSMAAIFTKGFRRGFETMRVPFEGKNAVEIRYHIGQEPMVREVIGQFREMGLEPIVSRCAGSRVNRRGIIKRGYETTPPSRQFEYDHRMDEALFLDNGFIERKLAALRAALEAVSEALPGYAGPAVIETFGEQTFLPKAKDAALHLDEEQRELSTRLASRAGQQQEEYLPGENYSFSIIAWPLPDIGEDFEAIFRDTISINTLSNEEYLPLQQKLIDAMDPADHILVEGKDGNRTRMKVKMRKLEHPEKETQFENCVADVNIPLGEVFTSPVLEGTEGTLHVSRVYLKGCLFLDLEIHFRDGVVIDYSCANYEDKEEGRRYIEENILYHHPTLPIGEFAIGTNVPAYRMARKYDILGRLPILIVEKTGPHFAVGDTCYSHAEDTAVYNPDGKEIISRENSFSLLRDTDPGKAYFNCHTDITIPYEEIGRIAAVYPDGSETDLLRDGRFVLAGTDELNKGEEI